MWDTLAESIVIRNIRRSGEFTASLSAVFFYPHFLLPQRGRVFLRHKVKCPVPFKEVFSKTLHFEVF